MKLDIELIRFGQDEAIHWSKRGRVALVVTASNLRSVALADDEDRFDLEKLREVLNTTEWHANGTREPIPAQEATMTNGKPTDDPSKYGGETAPGVMDPGPQPKPPAPSEKPAPDDESKKGSG